MPAQDLFSLKNKLSKLQWRMLVIAPHHDDESIGVGGTIADYSRRGGDIQLVTIFSGESGLPSHNSDNAKKIRNHELSKAAKILGISHVHNMTFSDRCSVNMSEITKSIIPVLRNFRPEIVITPHMKEQDTEHNIVARATREAVWLSSSDVFPNLGKACPQAKIILGYEVWTPIEKPQLYIDITNVLDIKLKAIEMHHSQVNNQDWIMAAKGLAAYRGITSGYGRFVEAFEVNLLTQDVLAPWFLEIAED